MSMANTRLFSRLHITTMIKKTITLVIALGQKTSYSLDDFHIGDFLFAGFRDPVASFLHLVSYTIRNNQAEI